MALAQLHGYLVSGSNDALLAFLDLNWPALTVVLVDPVVSMTILCQGRTSLISTSALVWGEGGGGG